MKRLRSCRNQRDHFILITSVLEIKRLKTRISKNGKMAMHSSSITWCQTFNRYKLKKNTISKSSGFYNQDQTLVEGRSGGLARTIQVLCQIRYLTIIMRRLNSLKRSIDGFMTDSTKCMCYLLALWRQVWKLTTRSSWFLRIMRMSRIWIRFIISQTRL